MTVTEYRKKYPNCNYCKHRIPGFHECIATEKRMTKRTARKCSCYIAVEWRLDKKESDNNAG